ncbi:YeeE/YedE family protein [Undibacterium sp.]|uniref:YeeE/YedE family protein n=1 Tax=Undibacterium sp. TaxID=1914977 RepID=UPI00374CEDF8
MTIDWNSFTPYASLLGGVLIGLAAAMLMLFSGRIAGISGIVGGLLHFGANAGSGRGWRIAFIVGLVAAPLVYQLFAALPESSVDASWPVLIVAGLLVGFGTRYGSGCTSGHGVCGLSRLSPRSLAATLLFMAAGFVSVYVMRHLLGAA